MTYSETRTSRINPSAAIRELADHGISALVRGDHIVESDSDENIVKIDKHGLVKGRAVLDWLGY